MSNLLVQRHPFPVIPASLALLGIGLGVGIGVLIPNHTSDACLQALDKHEAQYQQLEGVLPVAADAVQAAARRSASGLDATTARLATIQAKLEAGEGPLQQATAQCRGNK